MGQKTVIQQNANFHSSASGVQYRCEDGIARGIRAPDEGLKIDTLSGGLEQLQAPVQCCFTLVERHQHVAVGDRGKGRPAFKRRGRHGLICRPVLLRCDGGTTAKRQNNEQNMKYRIDESRSHGAALYGHSARLRA